MVANVWTLKKKQRIKTFSVGELEVSTMAARAQRAVKNAEDDIAQKIEEQDKAEKDPPRHRQQRVIKIERHENADAGPFDIECSILVEQPLPALFGNDRPEAEVAFLYAFIGSRSERIVEGFFSHNYGFYYALRRGEFKSAWPGLLALV